MIAVECKAPFSASLDSLEEDGLKVEEDQASSLGAQDRLPQALRNMLPAAYYEKAAGTLVSPEDSLPSFLGVDLDVSRLSNMFESLWWAGRPLHARSLCRQRMLKRDIVLTEQTDLHLLWFDSTIFIKPLPRYLCSQRFWMSHICNDQELFADACGFLLSYTWLICHESDFAIARELELIPSVKWSQWRTFIQDVRKHLNDLPFESINRRYLYGELRLNRLNIIYRFRGHNNEGAIMRGYLWGHHTYATWFNRNFAWIVVLFVYITIILTAMQVGLATTRLQPSKSFQDASYGFAVFSILLPLIVGGLVTAASLFLAAYYVRATRALVRPRKEQWGREARNGGPLSKA
ncbi:hypothetical protein MMC28_008845 [Mycoblastus sanguinarius]|nr:hypothetical protein [Mycoblastus sanguinarius]